MNSCEDKKAESRLSEKLFEISRSLYNAGMYVTKENIMATLNFEDKCRFVKREPQLAEFLLHTKENLKDQYIEITMDSILKVKA